MAVALRFLGANGTVTGSKLLVEHDGHRVLVDCGLYQGLKELRVRNRAPLPVDPASIDAVVVTHAHLDHVGHLPILVRDGFDGPIHATEVSAALAAIVLADSGRLQEEEARHAARHGWSKHDPPRPLYTEDEAVEAAGRFVVHDTHEPFDAAPGIRVELRRSGHILGSTWVLLEVGDRVVVVSGDLGRSVHPLLLPPEPLVEADAVVVESTYGDRRHEPPAVVVARMGEAIARTARRGGTTVIPAFAVDRTEMVLHALADLTDRGAIPRLPVHVDSPMALAALGVYRDAVRRGSDGLRDDLYRSAELFGGLDLREARTVEESKEIDRHRYPSIVVSASGMASGGRVLHHLAVRLPDPASSVLLVGFQAAGTRGRLLLEGARAVKLLGSYVPVRADVVDATGFSTHADADELLAWLGSASTPPAAAYVVHGEQSSSDALRDRIDAELGAMAVVPRYGERCVIP